MLASLKTPPLRLLAQFVRPAAKQGMNPRSFAFLKLALARKDNSVVFATFPKSGWNWSAEVLDYALTKHFTGAYTVDYAGDGTLKQRQHTPPSVFTPADARSSGRKRVREMFPAVDVDYCLHTHGAWRESPLLGMDAAKTVLIARNIPTTLYSYYRSRGGAYATFEACLADGALDRAIHFYNSWGDFCAKAGTRCRIFRYEDLRATPLPQFRALFEYVFGIDVGETLIAEALDYYSFQKQKEREWRYAADEKKHFHFRGGVDYGDLIDDETLRHLRKTLTTRLRHAFGYEYGAADKSAAPNLTAAE